MHVPSRHYLLPFGCGTALFAFALIFPLLALVIHRQFTMFEGNRTPGEWRALWIGIGLGIVAIWGLAAYYWRRAYLATASHPHRTGIVVSLVAIAVVLVLAAAAGIVSSIRTTCEPC